MITLIKISLSFIIFSKLVLGSEYFTGERNFDLYSGPTHPFLATDYRQGKTVFVEQGRMDNYVMGHISHELLDLNIFYDNFVVPSFSCTSIDFAGSADYIHYLHRLTALSLQYDFLKKIHISLYQINEAESKCPLEYEQLFKGCLPKSTEMKKFTARVEEFFPDIVDWGNYPLLRQKASFETLEKYHGKGIKIISSNFQEDDLEQTFLRACMVTKKAINDLCNEVDSYYGLSEFPEVNKMIAKTSAFKVANKNESGLACLEQFVDLNKSNEMISNFNNAILKSELDGVQELGQGLFWFGSLKEFDDLGVVVIKDTKKPILVEVTPSPVVAKAEVVVAPKVEVVQAPVVIPKPAPAPVKVVEVKKSALTIALEKFMKDKKATEVNMTYMKSDYKYTKKLLQKFNGPLRPYQTRKALTDMKKLDKLGSLTSPLSFLFLRFLLDHNLHQGLYNIKSILGDSFYIVDDVENLNKVVRIHLDNSEKTKFKWQLTILEAPL